MWPPRWTLTALRGSLRARTAARGVPARAPRPLRSHSGGGSAGRGPGAAAIPHPRSPGRDLTPAAPPAGRRRRSRPPALRAPSPPRHRSRLSRRDRGHNRARSLARADPCSLQFTPCPTRGSVAIPPPPQSPRTPGSPAAPHAAPLPPPPGGDSGRGSALTATFTSPSSRSSFALPSPARRRRACAVRGQPGRCGGAVSRIFPSQGARGVGRGHWRRWPRPRPVRVRGARAGRRAGPGCAWGAAMAPEGPRWRLRHWGGSGIGARISASCRRCGGEPRPGKGLSQPRCSLPACSRFEGTGVLGLKGAEGAPQVLGFGVHNPLTWARRRLFFPAIVFQFSF